MKATTTDIRHKGFVKEVNNNSLIVTIINQSACSSCHAKGACTVADYQDKEIEITDFKGAYKPGQEVTILFKESKGFTALLWGYVVPFLLVLLTLIVMQSLTGNELQSGLVSLAILIPYYITLYFFRHLLKKIFKFELEETD
ncbi:SoxR reducing system RseC family protein [Maribellus luteus]|uniref:SoxR reducing system RseC family protein n=1 Tax=Maribellus luteus TaxID=2305463 RepID=UPI00138FDBB5|nr:SoxR reducing system RseC family protein [Maribellus luteus]